MRQKIMPMVDILFYLIIYILIQIAFTTLLNTFLKSDIGLALSLTQALSAATTVAIFCLLRWSPLFTPFHCEKPALFFSFIILFTLASLLPTEWFNDMTEVDMPESMEQVFEQILSHPLGMIAIGLLAPVCEEVIFRGAILGRLLKTFGDKHSWTAIIISALIFGLAHGNLAQSPHAFAMGILFGWLFYRTGSLIPCILMHVINNSSGVVLFALMPQSRDAKLIDLFHGDTSLMNVSISISLAVAVITLLMLIKHTPEKGQPLEDEI